MNSVYGTDSKKATALDERPPRLRCIVAEEKAAAKISFRLEELFEDGGLQ